MDKHSIFATIMIVTLACFLSACEQENVPTQTEVINYQTYSNTTSECVTSTVEVTTNEINVSLSDKDLLSAEFMPFETIKISNVTTTQEETTTTTQEETTTTTQEETTTTTQEETTITTTTTTSVSETVQSYYTGLSSTEYDMVCAVVQAEANGGSLQFKEYIAGIIYNRIQSDDFPNTAYGVLTQANQFGSISNYYYNTYPIDDDTRLAVSQIFSGNDSYILYNLNGAVAYCNPNLVDSSTLSWFESSLRFTYQCTEYSDGIAWVHRFYAMP